MLLGDLEMAAKRPEAAVDAWKRIESQNPQYLALVAGVPPRNMAARSPALACSGPPSR